jgi:hypothetical protein
MGDEDLTSLPIAAYEQIGHRKRILDKCDMVETRAKTISSICGARGAFRTGYWLGRLKRIKTLMELSENHNEIFEIEMQLDLIESEMEEFVKTLD